MSDIEESLQERLGAYEAGVPLENVLGDQHGNSSEVSSLVSLAATLRQVPHPEPAQEKMAAAKGKFLAAARPKPVAIPQKKAGLLEFLSRPRVWIPALAGIGVILLLVSAAVLAAGCYSVAFEEVPPGRYVVVTDNVIRSISPFPGDGMRRWMRVQLIVPEGNGLKGFRDGSLGRYSHVSCARRYRFGDVGALAFLDIHVERWMIC